VVAAAAAKPIAKGTGSSRVVKQMVLSGKLALYRKKKHRRQYSVPHRRDASLQKRCSMCLLAFWNVSWQMLIENTRTIRYCKNVTEKQMLNGPSRWQLKKTLFS
jgi:hypothetical protein